MEREQVEQALSLIRKVVDQTRDDLVAQNWGLLWMLDSFSNLAAFVAIGLVVEARGLPLPYYLLPLIVAGGVNGVFIVLLSKRDQGLSSFVEQQMHGIWGAFILGTGVAGLSLHLAHAPPALVRLRGGAHQWDGVRDDGHGLHAQVLRHRGGLNDMRSLFEFLHKGNSVFIAVNSFNGALADTFHLRTELDYADYFVSIDSLIKKDGVKIKLNAVNCKKQSFAYSRIATSAYFTSFDTSSFMVHANMGKDKACFISTPIGKGTLYLMSMPDAFGNYFIVDHANRQLAYAMLSKIKNDELIWDEYYKTYNITSYSFIKFILESDALYTAYLLIIFIIILYMIFEGRRRQRAIPLVAPPVNSTLEFVNVVSHVYYNSKNHQSIAAEKIRYFYETVRKRFHVNTNQINENFLARLLN